MGTERKHGGRRPGAGRPSRFSWSTALQAAGLAATTGGLTPYDEARRRMTDPTLLPSRQALWRWSRRKNLGGPLLDALLFEAEQLARAVRDGLAGARGRAADFHLACFLLSRSWEGGEATGPCEDSLELRAEIKALVADLREARR